MLSDVLSSLFTFFIKSIGILLLSQRTILLVLQT